MSKPKNLPETMIHTIRITKPGVSPVNYAVMVSGEAENGQHGVWMTNYGIYDDSNPLVASAFEESLGKVTPFFEANGYLIGEWIDVDGEWLDGEDLIFFSPTSPL